MANEAILTPGYEVNDETPSKPTLGEQYLLADQNLADIKSAEVARYNLGVPSIVDLTQVTDTVNSLNSKVDEVTQEVKEYLKVEDPHGIKAWVQKEFPKYVKRDGSTAFTSPQSGVLPTKDEHLTTRGYVKSLLEQYQKDNNPEKLLPEVKKLLEDYLETSETTARRLDNCLRNEINKEFSKVARIDITNAFIKPQIGVYPTSDVHLSTKKYVDDKVQQHVQGVDPHGYITMLNQRLAKYAKIDEVLPATETYSRTQIDNEISKIVEEIINQELFNYKESVNNKFEFIRKENYVKQDGSVSFKNPQSGVDATEDSHLVTLRQLNQEVTKVSDELSDAIKKESSYWITSGPVETTVGFLEDNSRVPDKMSIQEVLDAIFYGKKVSVTSPETGNIGETVDVVVCITGGDLNTVDVAHLYQNGELVRVIQREEFEENGCVTITSNEIDGDTEFEFKVYYSNDAEHSEYSNTKLSYPIFAGIIDEWYFGTCVVYDDLIRLSKEDPVNNKFYDREAHLRELTHQYNFDEEKPVKLLLALPTTYPDLQAMMNMGQKFTKDAFSIICVTPFTINGVLTNYKLYIYNQPLVRLDSEITFKF